MLAVCLYHKKKLLLESHTLLFAKVQYQTAVSSFRELISGIHNPWSSESCIFVCSDLVSRSQAAKTDKNDSKL